MIIASHRPITAYLTLYLAFYHPAESHLALACDLSCNNLYINRGRYVPVSAKPRHVAAKPRII